MIKKFLFFTTLFLLVFGGGKAWAQSETLLVDFDFTDNSQFSTSTSFVNNGETMMTVGGKNIYFYHNNTGKSTFSLSSNGLTFGDNNMSSNYFVAIPLTGIKGEITVTFYHKYNSKKASYRYQIKDGATNYTPSDASTSSTSTDAKNADESNSVTINVTNGNAVFYFGRNGSSYDEIKRIVITTPETTGSKSLSLFEFNNDDILYYHNPSGIPASGRTAGSSVSTTFERNSDYGTNGYLRVKVNIDPDFASLDNPSFTVTSSNSLVLDASSATSFYKATTNRMYIDGVKVVGTGTATLTVTFNSATGYTISKSTTSATITVNDATAPTLSLTTPTSTTNAEIGNTIVLTANKAFSLVDGQYTTTDGVDYIRGTVNGNTVDFAVDLTKQTLTHTMGTTFAPNTLYEIVIPADKIKSSGVNNVEQTLSFTTSSGATLTQVSEKLWDFEEADGFPASQIAEIAVIDNMELVANSSKKMSFDNTAKSITDGDNTYNFTRQLKFGGTYASDGSNRIIHFKVAAGSTVNVFGSTGSNGSERTAAIRVAAKDGKFSAGTEVETLTSSTSKLEKGSFTIDAENYPNGAEVWVYSQNSGFNLSGIEVTTSKPKLTLSNPGQATSYAYSGSGEDSENYEIKYSYSGETNLAADDINNFTVTSSDEAIIKATGATIALDLTNKKFTITGLKVKSAGTATLTFKFAGNNTYAESSLVVPFTVTGKLPFSIKLEDLNIQQRQRRTIMPVITNASGNPIGFDASGNVIEMADDDDPVDYDTYFDFTYSLGSNDIGVTIDGNVVRAGDQTGGPVPVTVTATPKSSYVTLFTNGTASGTFNVNVTERTTGMYFDFYLDKECTTKVDDVYGTSLDGSTTVVEDFPNGRVLYLKLNDAGVAQNIQEIWFSTGKNETPVAVSRYVRDGEARTIYKDDPSKSQYLYKMDGGALPIYIDEALGADPYVFVNVQCYKDNAGSIEQAGSVIPVRFNIISHDRPGTLTYSPVSNNADPTIRNTAQTVVATGDTGNDIFAKFSSTGTKYTIEGLLNEPHVIEGVTQAGVFSTEVAARKISGVQIHTYDSDGDFVSTMNTLNYFYRFATTLNVSPKTITVRVGYPDDYRLPTSLTATYYDKVQKKDIDMSTGDKGATYTYSVASNTTSATQTTFDTDGTIHLGTTPGTVVLNVTYDNPTDITVNKRTSRMDVATATYIVKIVDESKNLPTITPDSKKYYDEFTATVRAHASHAAYYTTDGKDPSSSETRQYLAAGASASIPIPGDVSVGTVTTIKAVSDYGNGTYSSIVYEAYTKGAEVLPPYFVPSGDGFVPNYGTYYYYSETLPVEARVNTEGASIYYTLNGDTPEIGGETTYLYDGLRGITLSGTVTIKAFAYKDGIQSVVVTSRYEYGSIEPPYFSVDGSGKYTSGSQTVTTSNVITIGSDVVASTGTTLRHYYTLDGSDPSEDGGTLYTGGFTVVKTVTGKAYSVLVDASGNEVQQSAVTTVTFNVPSPLDVWEAVEETTPGGVLTDDDDDDDDGFIISRNNDIVSLYSPNDNNAETHVNLNSLSEEDGGNASKTYAQGDITVTFGGYEVSGKGKNWTSMTIADPAIGSPIDGVGKYSIAGPDNAKMEEKNNKLDDPSDNYNHMYSQLTTTHEKTFHLPCKGAFVKFEPEKDGEVTIWALQHGSLNYNDGITLCDKFIRYRPVYFVDEQGKSYPVKEVNGVPQLWSSARLSAEWAKIEATAASNSWTGWKESQTIIHQGKSMDVENKGLNVSESQAIYNMYKKYITDNNIQIGDPIKPFPVHNGTSISTNNGNYTDNSNDHTGYVMLTGGYVKYTFEVKAGKTYYFFGQGTKIGIRGFRFAPTEVAVRPTITFHANATDNASTVNVNGEERDLATVLSTFANTTVDVIVERNFSNHWAAIALPFSVSATQMEKVFGAGTEISHFRDIINSGRTIAFRHHKNQMLVAGTPAIIYPTKTNLSSVTFEGVRLEANTVETMTGNCDDFSMIGTFVRQPAGTDYSLNRYDYYFGANDGVIYRFNNSETASQAIQGTRAWLRPKNPEASSARMLSVGFEEVDDDEYTTGIIEITDDGLGERSKAKGAAGIYNLKGQKVGEGSLEGLAKGVYIINGKKMVVE